MNSWSWCDLQLSKQTTGTPRSAGHANRCGTWRAQKQQEEVLNVEFPEPVGLNATTWGMVATIVLAYQTPPAKVPDLDRVHAALGDVPVNEPITGHDREQVVTALAPAGVVGSA